MLPSADLSLISMGKPSPKKAISPSAKDTDNGFQDVMRKANADAEKKQPAVEKQDLQSTKGAKRDESSSSSSATKDARSTDNKKASADSSSDTSTAKNTKDLDKQGNKEISQNDEASSTANAEVKGDVSDTELKDATSLDETVAVGKDKQVNAMVDTDVPLSLDDAVDGATLAAGNLELTDTPLTIDGLAAGAVAAGAVISGGKELQKQRLEGAAVTTDTGLLNQEAVSGVEGNALTLDAEGLATENTDGTSVLNTAKDALDTNSSIGKVNSEGVAGNLTKEGDIDSSLLKTSSVEEGGVALSDNSAVLKPVNDATDAEDAAILSAQLAASLGLIAQNKDVVNKASASGVDKAAKVSLEGVGQKLDVAELADLAEGADPVELDWILQQMSKADTSLANSVDVSLAKDSVSSTVPKAAAASASMLALNGVDASVKNTSLSPLDLGADNSTAGLLDSADNTLLGDDVLGPDGLDAVARGDSKSNAGDAAVIGAAAMLAQATDVKAAQQGTAINNSLNTILSMQVPPTHPNWSGEMGDKLLWMTQQGIHKAEIHLDPPELGSLTVKISVDADSATVSFVVASHNVKDLLDGQIQRLRDMLAQQNISLDSVEVDVDVSRQGSGPSSNQRDGSQGTPDNFKGDDLESMAEESNLALNTAQVSSSRVDFYA